MENISPTLKQYVEERGKNVIVIEHRLLKARNV
jgi:hypothetical protein